MNNGKRLLAVSIIVIIVIASIVALLSNRSAPPTDQVLSVTIPDGVSVDIHAVTEADQHGTGTQDSNNLGAPVKTITKSEELRLPRGLYLATMRETSEYKTLNERFSLETQKVTLNLEPEYTDQKLKSLLATERPAIIAAFTTAYPQAAGLYNIQEGWLYKRGEWYGTKLLAKNNTDALRVILRKENNTWKVVTNPPDIVISSPKYPEIPREIVTDLNNFR